MAINKKKSVSAKIILGFWIFLFAIFAGTHANAQSQDFTSPFVIGLNPSSPAPLSEAEAYVSSFNIDLDKQNISWYVNGASAGSGIGKKSIRFKVGASGSKTSIKAVVTIAGENKENTLVIEPSSVDLIWEAPDSHVPPFYKGKALPTKESVLKVSAIPGRSGQGLIYDWKKGNTPLVGSSGTGKNSLIFESNYLYAEEKVSVTMTGGNGSIIKATKTASIPLGSPRILFYKKIGASVDYTAALRDIFLEEPMLISAEPYFFSDSDIAKNSLTYAWKINGQAIETPIKKTTLYLNPSGPGRSVLELFIEHPRKLFESTRGILNIVSTQ